MPKMKQLHAFLAGRCWKERESTTLHRDENKPKPKTRARRSLFKLKCCSTRVPPALAAAYSPETSSRYGPNPCGSHLHPPSRSHSQRIPLARRPRHSPMLSPTKRIQIHTTLRDPGFASHHPRAEGVAVSREHRDFPSRVDVHDARAAFLDVAVEHLFREVVF
jgi:hypothetical protein